MTQLRLRDLLKRFGRVTAVQDLDLTVESGQFVTLVGPSGCGKTTTLRLIAGFEAPDRGEIELAGRSILSLPPEERGVGIVFQNYALFPHMNVFDNVAYGLKFVEERVDRRARVRELLELVDLQGFERRRPSELSAGQQQRVALARALAPRPRVLLLDEPLSALDVQLRERLRLDVRRIQRELGVTTLYVTHDQEEALAISDRVGVMNEGRLEQVGRPWEVYHKPASAFVAEFIGRGNLLDGRVAEISERDVQIQLKDGQRIRLRKPPQCAGSLEPGQRVSFLVRHERLTLDGQGENRVPGVVRMIEYLGDAVLVHVEGAGERWLVKIPNPDEALLDSEDQGVTLGFSPADGRLYPAVPPVP